MKKQRLDIVYSHMCVSVQVGVTKRGKRSQYYHPEVQIFEHGKDKSSAKLEHEARHKLMLALQDIGVSVLDLSYGKKPSYRKPKPIHPNQLNLWEI